MVAVAIDLPAAVVGDGPDVGVIESGELEGGTRGLVRKQGLPQLAPVALGGVAGPALEQLDGHHHFTAEVGDLTVGLGVAESASDK